jgi:hypothetical protein
MADYEFNYGNPCIGAMQSDKRRTVTVPVAASVDPNTGTEQSNIQTLTISNTSLTKQSEYSNDKETRTELEHGNDHEYNGMTSNAGVNSDQEEILITTVSIDEKADKQSDCHTLSQFEHDTTSNTEEKEYAEGTLQEHISVVTDRQINYSLHEYKFENSSQITRAWNEFVKKKDICMKGCKW